MKNGCPFCETCCNNSPLSETLGCGHGKKEVSYAFFVGINGFEVMSTEKEADEAFEILEKIVFPAAEKYGLSKNDIICEDLGTLTDPVKNIMNSRNLTGIAVTQYDYRGKDVPEKNVIMPGSHDNESYIEYTDKIFGDAKHLGSKVDKLVDDTIVPNENKDAYAAAIKAAGKLEWFEQAKLIENSDEEFFFGYEESYGSVIKPFVRDKDSFQATLLLAEVASYYKEQGKTLVNVLDEIYEEYGYYLEGVQNISLTGLEGQAKIKKIMSHFQNATITSMGGKEIVTVEDYDKSVSVTGGVETPITLPKSLVLKYIYEDGGWFALRPSGTEPKLKIYIAIKDKDKASAERFIENLKAEVMEIINNIE